MYMRAYISMPLHGCIGILGSFCYIFRHYNCYILRHWNNGIVIFYVEKFLFALVCLWILIADNEHQFWTLYVLGFNIFSLLCNFIFFLFISIDAFSHCFLIQVGELIIRSTLVHHHHHECSWSIWAIRSSRGNQKVYIVWCFVG